MYITLIKIFFPDAALYAVRSHRKDAPWLLTLLGVVYTSSKIILPYLCAPFITDINIHHDKVNYRNFGLNIKVK